MVRQTHRATEPAGGDAHGAEPESGPAGVEARLADGVGRWDDRSVEDQSPAVGVSHTDRRPGVGDHRDDVLGDIDVEEARAVRRAGRHQGPLDQPTTRTEGLRSRHPPSAGDWFRLEVARAGEGGPHAVGRPPVTPGPTRLGQDGQRVEVTLDQPADGQVAGGTGRQRLEPFRRSPRPRQRHVGGVGLDEPSNGFHQLRGQVIDLRPETVILVAHCRSHTGLRPHTGLRRRARCSVRRTSMPAGPGRTS